MSKKLIVSVKSNAPLRKFVERSYNESLSLINEEIVAELEILHISDPDIPSYNNELFVDGIKTNELATPLDANELNLFVQGNKFSEPVEGE